MDPMFVLISWLIRRVYSDGFLFFNILRTKSLQLGHSEPWTRIFCFIDARPIYPDWNGKNTAKARTGHSRKRGGVQMLRFLCVKDSYIMQWFDMFGDEAYLRYIESINNLQDVMVPDFCSIHQKN